MRTSSRRRLERRYDPQKGCSVNYPIGNVWMPSCVGPNQEIGHFRVEYADVINKRYGQDKGGFGNLEM